MVSKVRVVRGPMLLPWVFPDGIVAQAWIKSVEESQRKLGIRMKEKYELVYED